MAIIDGSTQTLLADLFLLCFLHIDLKVETTAVNYITFVLL